eukprot:GEZU01013804.1.p1 GENE.GEZU01013804.1~~GEZU01013804.1.p1  ORF type:complete len:1192 (+),score=267.06 GEZU01013804.1:155-3730(+)
MFAFPSVCPKVIPGPPVDTEAPLDPIVSRYSVKSDWGINNLVAYCCQKYVVIIDPISVQFITTLDGHKSTVTCCRWCPGISGTNRWLTSPNRTTLVSGDDHGNVIVWDAVNANAEAVLTDAAKKPVIDIQFHSDKNYLLVLYANATLSLWNIQTKTRVWRKEFTEPVVSMHLNPFNDKSLCLSALNGWILFVHDLNLAAAPENVERKMRVGGAPPPPADKSKPAPTVPQTHLRDVVYSPHKRNQVYLALRRDVKLFDIELQQTIEAPALGGRNEFHKLFFSKEDPMLVYSLHEDGSVAAWRLNKKINAFEPTFCDVVRGSKHGGSRPGLLFTLCYSPVEENRFCAISNDGKIWLWDCTYNKKQKFKWTLRGLLESLQAPITSICVSPFDSRVAVGTSAGKLIVQDLLLTNNRQKFEVFNSPVRGIRWAGRDKLVCFSSRQQANNTYRNFLIVLDIKTGKQTELRKSKSDEIETTFIRGIRVSYSMNYMIVLLKDSPIEVWNLNTNSLLRIMQFPQVTALEWCPLKSAKKDTTAQGEASTPSDENKPHKEHFIFTSADGSLHFYRVDQQQRVFADTKQPKMFSYNSTTALAWKDDLLVSGDQTGTVTCWEISQRKSHNFNNHRGMVKKIKFSPDFGNHYVLVLFADGDYGIWDLDKQIKISHSIQKDRDVRAIDVDWAPGNYPVIATTTGAILVLDLTLSSTNSNVMLMSLSEPMGTPSMLPKTRAMFMKSLMENGLFGIEAKKQAPEGAQDSEQPSCSPAGSLADLSTVDEELVVKLNSDSTSTPERCLLTAKYFGDDEAIKFWSIVIHYFNLLKETPQRDIDARAKGSSSVLSPMSASGASDSAPSSVLRQNVNDKDAFSPLLSIRAPASLNQSSTLPAKYDLLRDNNSVRHHEMTILATHDKSVRSSAKIDYFRPIAHAEALLGEKENAVSLLLDTPADHKDFFINSLHACVIAATVNDPVHFQHTMKFVASNFIASGDLNSGVELLCLIGKGFDACRYLQIHDKWDDAARLAKSTLPEDECNEILKRWATHLANTGQILKSVEIWLSMGAYAEVLKLLYDNNYDDLAALFLRSCEENGVWQTYTEEAIKLEEKPMNLIIKIPSPKELKKLIYGVYTRYISLQEKTGNTVVLQKFSDLLSNHFRNDSDKPNQELSSDFVFAESKMLESPGPANRARSPVSMDKEDWVFT